MLKINDPEVTVCTIDDALDLYACAALQRLLAPLIIMPLSDDRATEVCAQAWQLAQAMQRTRPGQQTRDDSTSSPAGGVHTARALLNELSRTAQMEFSTEHMNIEADKVRIPYDLLRRIRDYLQIAGGI